MRAFFSEQTIEAPVLNSLLFNPLQFIFLFERAPDFAHFDQKVTQKVNPKVTQNHCSSIYPYLRILQGIF